jgi:hypothetical protein
MSIRTRMTRPGGSTSVSVATMTTLERAFVEACTKGRSTPMPTARYHGPPVTLANMRDAPSIPKKPGDRRPPGSCRLMPSTVRPSLV